MSFVTTRWPHVLAGKLEAKRSDCAPVASQEHAQPRLEHRVALAGKATRSTTMRRAWHALPDIFLDGHKELREEIVRRAAASTGDRHSEPGRFKPWQPTAKSTSRSTSSAAGSCWRRAAPRQHRGAAGAVDEASPASSPASGRLAERCGSCSRGDSGSAARSDGVVRGRGCRPVRPGAQRAIRRRAVARGLGGSAVVPGRKAPCSGRLPDMRPLEPTAGGNQGRAPRAAVPIRVSAWSGRRPIGLTRLSLRPLARWPPHQGCQLDLFADRSSAKMPADQLRLWFAVDVLTCMLSELRHRAPPTEFADATMRTIRLEGRSVAWSVVAVRTDQVRHGRPGSPCARARTRHTRRCNAPSPISRA